MGERVRFGRALGALCGVVVMLAVQASASTATATAFEVTPPGSVPVSTTVPPVARPPLSSAAPSTGAAGDETLVGVFAIDAGACTGSGTVRGSSFRMIQPGGTADGPFLANSDSPCDDQTYTPLSPGDDGGLSTAALQPNPATPFDGNGNGTAAAITRPQKFLGVAFAVSTNAVDPQSSATVSTPAIITNGDGSLRGDLRAVSVAYNRQHFNQGSPKPDGSHPGLTAGPAGTYDASTRAFKLDWTSTIVGGPFNNFTGMWHLEGTFQPSAAPAASAVPAEPIATVAPPAGGSAQPVTGGTLPEPLALALGVAGAGGLVLRRRAATARSGAAVGTAATAGGRARRP